MNAEELLIPEEEYQKSGVHIGTQVKSKDMKDYIFKIRDDGLYILNIKMTNSVLITAGKMLARFSPSDILVVAQRQYAFRPVSKFSEVVRSSSIIGRFIPGTLTNPQLDSYKEAKVIIATDPLAESRGCRTGHKPSLHPQLPHQQIDERRGHDRIRQLFGLRYRRELHQRAV